MKATLTIFTLACLTLACMRDSAIIVSFGINRSFIAHHLCEQRDRPGNSCRGLCHLRKQLEKADQKGHALSANTVKETDGLHPVPADPALNLVDPIGETFFFPRTRLAVLHSPPRELDHPPNVLSSWKLIISFRNQGERNMT